MTRPPGSDLGPGLTFVAAVILGVVGCLVFWAVVAHGLIRLLWGQP